jgi:hypothetical protein
MAVEYEGSASSNSSSLQSKKGEAVVSLLSFDKTNIDVGCKSHPQRTNDTPLNNTNRKPSMEFVNVEV